MKKLLAILLAASMLFAFAACGDKTGGNEATEAPAIEETEAPAIDETEAPAVDETEAPVEGEVATEAPVEGETAAPVEGESSTAAPAADMTKAEFVAFINAETAKAVKGSYKYNRNCSYTKKVDVGGATGILNGIISAIDENSNLDTVVGGFLGIGTKTGTNKDVKDDYAIKATKLTEADLQNFKASNGTYTFTLANAKNPKKTNATPISRFTNDFITTEEVRDSIAETTTAVTVNDETVVNYKNIKVTVKVVDGKIASISYSYDFDAELILKAGIKITGTGAAKTTGTFTEIKY